MADDRYIAIESAVHASVHRVVSWMPEHRAGGGTIVLAGRELPATVGARLRGPIRVMCVAPGDWLVVSHQHHPVIVREHFGVDLPKYGLVLADLSDALAGLVGRGPGARELLSKGCGLDFHPKSFPADSCARTRFAQIAVVIEAREEETCFELYVARSHSAYLRDWLTDAAVDVNGR